MGMQVPDLPAWEFTVTELSPGIYRARALRDGGIHGEASGTDVEDLLDGLKEWARKTEADLSSDG